MRPSWFGGPERPMVGCSLEEATKLGPLNVGVGAKINMDQPDNSVETDGGLERM